MFAFNAMARLCKEFTLNMDRYKNKELDILHLAFSKVLSEVILYDAFFPFSFLLPGDILDINDLVVLLLPSSYN